MNPSHPNGRSRFDHLPPASNFVDSNYYYDHHRPPPPSPIHHYQHHQQRHDRELQFRDEKIPYSPPPPNPHPPSFDPHPNYNPLRVSDRRILIEPHPMPPPHPSSRGEHYRREFLDDDEFRVFEERPARSEWDTLPPSRDLSYPPEDHADSYGGRTNFRWNQNRILEEDDSGGGDGRRPLELYDGQGIHRHYHHPNKNRIFEPIRREGEQSFSHSEQHRSSPSLLPADRSYPNSEVLDMNSYSMAVETKHDYMDNRGMMSLSRGYTPDIGSTPSKQKRSALSRIQSGKSVWDRIKEKPNFSSSSSPPPPLPTQQTTLPPPNSSEEQQLAMDGLDLSILSYKSNALVAKVMEPPTLVPPSPNEKSSTSSNTKVATTSAAPKRKVIVKKVVKRRKKVVAPIDTSGSALKEGVSAERPLASCPSKVSGHGKGRKASQKAIVSSDQAVSDMTPKLCPRKVVKKKVLRKKPVKSLKLVQDVGQTRKCGNLEIKPTNETSSMFCEQGVGMVTTSLEKNSSEQQPKTSIVKVDEIKYFREEHMTLGKNDGKISSNHVVSDMGVSQVTTKDLLLVERELVLDTSKQAPEMVEDVNNSTHTGFAISPIKESSVLGCGVNGQVVTSVGSSTLFDGIDIPKGKCIKRKREREVKLQLLDSDTMLDEHEILAEKCEHDDPSLNLHYQGTPIALSSRVDNVDLNQTLIDGAIDDQCRGLSSPIKIGMAEDDFLRVGSLTKNGIPESDFCRDGQDYIKFSFEDSISELLEQPLPSRHSEEDGPINVVQPYSHIEDSKVLSSANYNNDLDEISVNELDPLVSSKRSLALEACEDVKSGKGVSQHLPIPGKAQLLSFHRPKKLRIAESEVIREKVLRTNANLSSVVSRVFQNQTSLTGSVKENAHSSHNARNKTWHRNNVPSSTSAPSGDVQFQSLKKPNSYIRKGNSLIRKSTTQQPHGIDASSRMSGQVMERSTTIEMKVEGTDRATCSNHPFERPRTPPLPVGTKLPVCHMNALRDQIPEAGVGTQGRVLEGKTVDLLSDSVDDLNFVISTTNESIKSKRGPVYVNHKSNQLVAAPWSENGDTSTHPNEGSQTLPYATSSDLHYKRKKNQLILSDLTSNSRKSDEQRPSIAQSLRSSTTSSFKKRRQQVLQKTCNYSKSSLVWTLSAGKSRKKGVTSFNCWKVLPQLLPWKRRNFRKHSIYNIISTPNRQSLSLISRKLQHLRKRDTIYKVSTDGFSLRKTGVLSTGGSSLKWSKSIERHSKKASEEATLAVAEVQRKKRERESTSKDFGKKLGNCFPHKSAYGIKIRQGERIFRVGSARYKMDSSKRTLIRIPDEQSSSAIAQTENNTTPLTPRRLIIGNDEYVRIGSGNQLVRDPKKLIRILASEKVRWSLHNARSRMAKKRQYCQFFTRFGKCNKNDGKCLFIHDPAKVAICTKFLRGLCFNTTCKLVHKVQPERMPDCSYFLQELCTNIKCPYRHVNVNPNASVCEAFLRGYCADGDECCKKHSYVCPHFEVTGKCPEGSKCKLHHPKASNKPKRRKQLLVQSNNNMRYFDSSNIEVAKTLIVASGRDGEENGEDIFYSDGQFADYINLDSGGSIDDECVETNVPMDSHPTEPDSDLSDMQLDDLDMLVNPIRIMNQLT